VAGAQRWGGITPDRRRETRNRRHRAINPSARSNCI